jgi:C-terminal processing protease CtpA/Prc
MRKRLGFLLSFAALLSSCGDGGGGGDTGTPIVSVPGGGTGGTASGCSLRARQDWAAAQLKEWYLFPETLPASLDPTPYATVDAYIDALTANARAQGRDRFFTYLTSIAEENAFNSSGATAGFGFRISFDSANRLFVMESFEGAPALAAGIDRGTEIVAIGTSASTLQNVSTLLANGGSQAVNDAIGPGTPGLVRVFRIRDAAGTTRDVTVTKANYDLQPVSPRYGAQVIVDRGRKVGYVNLRTFILSADDQLKAAFAQFSSQGITDVIVDLRYNGGGLLSVAEYFGDLLGKNRKTSEVFDTLAFRPEKASNNATHTFSPQPESIAPRRIAFIGTSGTASASELMLNGMLPYLHANEALIGTNTYGKPVGQIAVDNSPCDDRFRIIAFAVQNGAGQSGYFSGMKQLMEATCSAGDDFSHQMGDPLEASTKTALDYLAGASCTPIAATASNGITPEGTRESGQQLVVPNRPNEFQRIMPGSY